MSKFNSALIAVLFVAGGALQAQATLVGDTVTCTAVSGLPEFPINCNPTTAVIGSGVEFTIQDPSQMVLDILNVDPDMASVILSNPLTADNSIFFPGDEVTLSGLDWVDDPFGILVGITNFSTTAIGAGESNISFGPRRVTIDLGGITFRPGDVLTFELVKGTQVIPLPPSALLLLGGLAVIGSMRRRRTSA